MNAEYSSFKQIESTLNNTTSPTIAYLPVGCTEQHGPILPLGTDTLVAKKIAENLCTYRKNKDKPGVTYPGIAYSPSRSNANFPGSTTIAEGAFREYCSEVCRSILHHEFDALTIICMHGPAEPSLVEIAFQYNQQQFEFSDHMRPIIVLGVSQISGVFQKWLGSFTGKHADYREFLLLFKATGADFFKPEVIAALEKFNRHYAKHPLSNSDLYGIPMELRSVEGVIGAPMHNTSQSHSKLAEDIWNDILVTFSECIDRSLTDLQSI